MAYRVTKGTTRAQLKELRELSKKRRSARRDAELAAAVPALLREIKALRRRERGGVVPGTGVRAAGGTGVGNEPAVTDGAPQSMGSIADIQPIGGDTPRNGPPQSMGSMADIPGALPGVTRAARPGRSLDGVVERGAFFDAVAPGVDGTDAKVVVCSIHDRPMDQLSAEVFHCPLCEGAFATRQRAANDPVVHVEVKPFGRDGKRRGTYRGAAREYTVEVTRENTTRTVLDA